MSKKVLKEYRKKCRKLYANDCTRAYAYRVCARSARIWTYTLAWRSRVTSYKIDINGTSRSSDRISTRRRITIETRGNNARLNKRVKRPGLRICTPGTSQKRKVPRPEDCTGRFYAHSRDPMAYCCRGNSRTTNNNESKEVKERTCVREERKVQIRFEWIQPSVRNNNYSVCFACLFPLECKPSGCMYTHYCIAP